MYKIKLARFTRSISYKDQLRKVYDDEFTSERVHESTWWGKLGRGVFLQQMAGFFLMKGDQGKGFQLAGRGSVLTS